MGTRLSEILKAAAESALINDPNNTDIQYLLKSTAERQLDYGLSKPLRYLPRNYLTTSLP